MAGTSPAKTMKLTNSKSGFGALGQMSAILPCHASYGRSMVPSIQEKQMTIEALWTVEIPDVKGGWINGGVVVLETGRIFGGDSFYYFLGNYDVSGGNVSGTLNVTHYNGPQSTT
jgi:hypothetical protein